MGLMDSFKIRAALAKHQKGDIEGAKKDYEALIAEGNLKPAYLLPYSVLLLREGGDENFQKVKNLLAKIQRAPELSKDERSQLLMNYAVADWKLGNREKAVKLLESAHREHPCGLTYETLGYLYVETGDADKALSFNTEAYEYDDEDSITLDNLGQLYYRLLNDKAKAREYFEQAHTLKAGQIDTLWFLSRYDLEEGKTEAAIEKLETALGGRFSPLNHISREQVEQELKRLRAET